MLVTATIVPNYGKSYSSKAQVLDAWNMGETFQLIGIGTKLFSTYCSKRHIKTMKRDNSVTRIKFKFASNLSQCFMLNI